MSRVEITLNGRGYMLACEDGQENRLRELAAYVDGRVQEVAGDTSGGSEAQILVLTTLVLADELFDLHAEIQALKTARPAPAQPIQVPQRTAAEDETVVAAVDSLAKKLEDIAQRLERA